MKKIYLVVSLLYLTNTIYSQDHYWSQQYGGQASLMGGTSVSGTNDNSSIYYNPGAIGFIDSARITASTYLYGFEYALLKNGAGNKSNLKGVRVNILPQLLAGSILIRKLPKLKFIYGTLTRGRTNIRFTQENEGYYEVIQGSTGVEYYKGRAEYSYNSVEQWAGFGLSYKINNHWSVGLSSFGSYTHMEVRTFQNANVEATSNGNPYTTTVNEYNAMRLNQMMQVFKLGLSARFDHIQFGIALTTPGIKIWGEGRLEKSFEVYNLNLNASDTTIPAQQNQSYQISDIQRKLATHYKIPFSASAGLKVIYPGFNISVALEYFAGYKTNTVLKGQERALIRPSPIYGNEPVSGFMQLNTSATFVVNGGLGAEVKLSPRVNLLFGARTDFSNHTEYLPNNTMLGVAATRSPKWHYLYFSTGFTYKLESHNLTTGFDYGIGFGNSHQQLFNLTEPEQENFLRGNLNQTMKTSVHKLNFILSYIYFFKTKEKKYGPFSIIDELNKIKHKKNSAKTVSKNPAAK